jgi:hypothetical protein
LRRKLRRDKGDEERERGGDEGGAVRGWGRLVER